jgi:hypothetical protein
MAKFKTYDYRQRVLLPVSLEDQLMPGTLEFAVHTLVEKRLDMSIFEECRLKSCSLQVNQSFLHHHFTQITVQNILPFAPITKTLNVKAAMMNSAAMMAKGAR